MLDLYKQSALRQRPMGLTTINNQGENLVMKVYRMLNESGSGHKEDKVELIGFKGEKAIVTRGELKEAIRSKKVCVTNMTVTQNNRLVKVAEKVSWLNVSMVSYDVNNGICEVKLKSDELDQINEFIVGIERKVITEGCTDKGCAYGFTKDASDGQHSVIVRWVHIDQVVRTLKGIPHKFSMKALREARGHENFSYMSDEQFGMLCHYLESNLTCVS